VQAKVQRLKNWAHSAKGAHPYRKACRSRGIMVAAPPLDSPCDGPVTYPGDTKILVKSSKERSGPTLNIFLNRYFTPIITGYGCL